MATRPTRVTSVCDAGTRNQPHVNTPSLPVIWHEAYEVDIGPHVFPTRKYRLVRDRLVHEGIVGHENIRRPNPATVDEIGLVHSASYLRKVTANDLSAQERMTLEVPPSAALREAMWLCTGGSILAGELALDRGLAVHLGGGFHHAFSGHGEGFCLVNDVAIAIRVLTDRQVIRRAAVIDLDVHHGNGTAAIFANEPDVFTFSMHQENNYPARKPPSDLDIGLRDGTGDDEYLSAVEHHVPKILDSHRPDLVFYLAGADPYEHDQLGGLGLTLSGLRRRDRLVFDALTSAGVPGAVTLAGGYAVNQDDTVEIHCGTVREAVSHAG